MKKQFKKGAASFYIVAFATLILMVLALSFTAVIISEMTRTSNDDLAQSAYDSAMAGIEDAKLAFYNYQNCKAKSGAGTVSGGVSCKDIIDYVEVANKRDCNMVGNILGRVTTDEGVEIKQGNVNNNMQQFYTCTKIATSLVDYRATLSSSNPTKVIKAKFDGVNANDIKKVKINWYSDTRDAHYNNYSASGSGMFKSASSIAVPPTVSLAMVQTGGDEFRLSDFDSTVYGGERCDDQSGCTDRGMIYLVPNSGSVSDKTNYYKGAKNGLSNTIPKDALIKSNDKVTTNLPYVVKCDDKEDFWCSAEIELPSPIKSQADAASGVQSDGTRNNNTFVFVVSLPYGKPTTDFSLEFYCADGNNCANSKIEGRTEETASANTNLAFLKSVQVEVDSTGRANDLFRRVVTRLENNDDFALSIAGALELLGSGYTMQKDFAINSEEGPVICEYNFGDTTCD